MAKRKREGPGLEAETDGGAAGKRFKSSIDTMEVPKPKDQEAEPVDFEDMKPFKADKEERNARRLAKREKRLAAKASAAGDIQAPKESKAWTISDAVGGYLLDIDPLFSGDEQYLLLAYEACVKIYAAATSLLVRTLHTGVEGVLTGFNLSVTHPALLYITLSSGYIEKWDWSEGLLLGKWFIKAPIYHLGVATAITADMNQEVVFTVDGDFKAQRWMITAHCLRGSTESAGTELHTLYRCFDPITQFRVLDGGRTIVASIGRRLIVGNAEPTSSAALKALFFTWREIECSEIITSLDARLDLDGHNIVPSKTASTALAESASLKPVDIVVGGMLGTVFVYHDLLGRLIQAEKTFKAPVPGVRRQHWHRNVVGAVKWSADGNYVISGGLETVLVLWQLDTGQRQYLPHLSAPIENLVVSPSGSSYAIRTADNSAMVLSTLDLKPTVSIPGMQLPSPKKLVLQSADVHRASTTKFDDPHLRLPAAAISPSNPLQLLLAVPAISSSRSSSDSSSYNAVHMQTYDVRSGTQVSRQALTRSNITDRNRGPEGNIIEEPNTVLLRVSDDGKWLATVDEWVPPQQELYSLNIDHEAAFEAQMAALEVYLKFWLWNSDLKIWELVTRVEAPHSAEFSSNGAAGRILDLVEDPSRCGFVTLGVDGLIKIWRPKIRTRDGLEVRGQDGQSLTNWTCHLSIPLMLGDSFGEASYGRLALSADGSLLVVAHQSSSGLMTYLIDAATGEISSTIADLFCGTLIGIGILGRYLILLSDELIVWNVVDDCLNYGLTLRSYAGKITRATAISATHLAIDQKNGTFAVAFPGVSRTKGARGRANAKSQFAIFDPQHESPIFTTELPRLLKILLPSASRRSYFAIDSSLEVRTLSPATQVPQTAVEPSIPELVTSAGLENIFGKGKSMLAIKANDIEAGGNSAKSSKTTDLVLDEHDTVVIGQHQLAEIFDVSQPFALPPVTSLFEQVAGLFAKKVAVA